MANLNDEKSLSRIAKTIYEFELGQSCCIMGYTKDAEGEAVPRGSYVIDLLKTSYVEDYIRPSYKEKGSNVRVRHHYPDSVGGAKAHPIWRFKIVDFHKYTIWRVQ